MKNQKLTTLKDFLQHKIYPIAQIIFLAFSCYITGYFGTLIAIPPDYATAIYPPSGIALAGVLLLGYRAGFGVFIGSFFINLSTVLLNTAIDDVDYKAVLLAVVMALGATSQAIVGTYLVKRFADFPNPLATEKHIISFMFYGAMLSSLVNASISILTLSFANKIPWLNSLDNWLTWWIGDAIGIAIFTPLILVFFSPQYHYAKDRKLTIAISSFIAFFCITIFFFHQRQKELENIKLTFAKQSFEIQMAFEEMVEKNLDVLSTLQIFYNASEQVTRHDFYIVTSSFLKNLKGIHAIGWSPIIFDKNRKDFESSVRKESEEVNSEFEITQLDENKKKIRANTQEKYVPVTYIEPLLLNSAAIGYNLYSEKSRREVLDYARDFNTISLTPKITLVQSQQKQYGAFIAYIPIYKNNYPHETVTQRQENIVSYVSAVFEIDELIKSVVNSKLLSPETHEVINTNKLNFLLTDESPIHSQGVLFSNQIAFSPAFAKESIFSVSKILAGNHKWRFEITPTPDYFTYYHERESILLSLIVSFLLSSILNIAVLISSGRGYLLKVLVEEKADALAKSEQRLHEIINLMPLPVFVKDSQCRIVLMNFACEMQWGMKFSDLKNTTGSQFFPVEQITKFLENDNAIFDSNNLVEFEEAVWNADLRQNRIVHTYKKPVLNEMGEPDYLIGISVDITENKEHEKMMLEAKVAAETLAQSKSDFLANMSHEIRTPMNGIIGLSQLALNKQLSPEIRDYLEKIYTSSVSLLAILNDILDFSKIESGKFVIEKTDFKLVTLLRNLHNLFSISAENKAIEFSIESDSNIPTNLVGDMARIQQILSNLLGNAFKFTEQGEIQLKLELLEHEQERVQLRFSVNDTGIGIAENDREKLCKPFSQVDASITRRFGGTGLGLAISHNMLQLMDSQFEIDSELGKGSSFSFNLWLDVGSESAKVNNATVQHSVKKQGTLSLKLHEYAGLLAGSTVLVAEDNLINQQVVCEFLKLTKINVDVAQTGLEVLALLEQHTYDAILMDVNMPEMGGLEATTKIRSKEIYANLPIIALTAGVTSEEQQKCLDIGMNYFIRKPVNPEELIRVLCQAIHPNSTEI